MGTFAERVYLGGLLRKSPPRLSVNHRRNLVSERLFIQYSRLVYPHDEETEEMLTKALYDPNDERQITNYKVPEDAVYDAIILPYDRSAAQTVFSPRIRENGRQTTAESASIARL